MKKISFKLFSVLTLSIILIAACSTPQVAIDYDRSFNFSKVKTYQFENEPLGIGQFDSVRLYDAIQNTLMKKGLSTKENPDVIFRIAPNEYIEKQPGQVVGVGVGGGGRGGFGGVNVGIPIGGGQKLKQDFKVGMYDPNTKKLLWEGILNLTLGMKATPDERKTIYQNGVEKLFANYPPEG